jgi:threonine dehydrogenase-like Zn-dependent dehydrogenase
MKGVVFVGDGKLELRDFPDPTPGPRDVVLEIKASGMRGSDLHVYRATFKPADASSGFKRGAEPVIASHEPCGVVVAVGTGVTPKEAHSGQRVTNHHYTGCGSCKHCRSGWAQMCLEGPIVFGANGNGGHARYMKVPVHTLVPLARTWGTACYVGERGQVTLDASPDLLRQITLVGSWTFSTQGQADCAEFIADHNVDVDKLFTHRWRLDQAEEAYRLFDTQTTGKGVILPS